MTATMTPPLNISTRSAASAQSGANYAQVKFGDITIPSMGGISFSPWLVVAAIIGGVLWYKYKK